MASSSNSESTATYDVFLSFRGLDTRKKFTDHLYEALNREGFRTFRDDDEIPTGKFIKPELRKAIMNSRMSVVVLSKNYANSTACLFELQLILQRVEASDHLVLPVFFEVDPQEIKKQAEKLNFSEKEVTEEQKGWSEALKDVARMKGMVSQNQCDGYEAKFIEEIIGEVKSKLREKHVIIVDHQVSTESRPKRLMIVGLQIVDLLKFLFILGLKILFLLGWFYFFIGILFVFWNDDVFLSPGCWSLFTFWDFSKCPKNSDIFQ